VDQLVRSYLHRNGNYRSNAVLHSAYVMQADSTAATTWLLDVSQAAADPTVVLQDIVNAKWIPQANRGPIYQRIPGSEAGVVGENRGLEQENAKSDLWTGKCAGWSSWLSQSNTIRLLT